MKTVVIILLSLLPSFMYSQKQGTFTDSRDKKVYNYTTVGKQVWMSQNLNFEMKIGSWCYDKKKENCDKYGRLYNWLAASKACPEADGWLLPSADDWSELEFYLGMTKKENKGRGWRGTQQAAKLLVGGETGFNAAYTGYRYNNGKYFDLNHGAGYWTSTAQDETEAFRRFINADNEGIDADAENMYTGFSVRCIMKK